MVYELGTCCVLLAPNTPSSAHSFWFTFRSNSRGCVDILLCLHLAVCALGCMCVCAGGGGGLDHPPPPHHVRGPPSGGGVERVGVHVRHKLLGAQHPHVRHTTQGTHTIAKGHSASRRGSWVCSCSWVWCRVCSWALAACPLVLLTFDWAWSPMVAILASPMLLTAPCHTDPQGLRPAWRQGPHACCPHPRTLGPHPRCDPPTTPPSPPSLAVTLCPLTPPRAHKPLQP